MPRRQTGPRRPPRSGLPAWSLVVGGVVAVTGLVLVFASSGGIGDVASAVRHASAEWALAAVLAELACYALLGLHLRRLAGEPRISELQGIRVSLLSFGLGNVLPGSPAPGMLLAGAELRRLGRSPRRTRLVLGFTLWFTVRTLVGISALAFLIAIVRDHPALREFSLWSLAAVGVILTLALTARMASRPQTAQHAARAAGWLRISRPRPPVDATRDAAVAWYAEARSIVGTPGNRALLVAIAASSWLADAACLRLALAATGVRVDADILLVVYAAGMFVAALPLLPGGIGAVEAAVPALLHHFGAPLDAALAGTLVYRGIALLLPAVAGTLVLGHIGVRRRKAEPASDTD